MHRIITSLDDLKNINGKILCLFSGGLDSSYLISKLTPDQKKDALCLHVNIGGSDTNTTLLKKISAHLGVKVTIIDGVSKFAEQYLLPAIKAQARYLGTYPISASLSRPLLASLAADHARKHNFSCILHSATKDQNSLRRFNGAFNDLKVTQSYGSPYEQSHISRADKIEALKKLGLEHFGQRNISRDSNIWCSEYESGSLKNPETIELENIPFYAGTSLSKNIPDQTLTIDFVKGVPQKVNNRALKPVNLINKLNEAGTNYQIGWHIGFDELASGRKVLETRVTPAADILLKSYKYLESACISSEDIRIKMHLEQAWVQEAVEGRWFGQKRLNTQNSIEKLAREVSGQVTVLIQQNTVLPLRVKAQKPKYISKK